MHRACMLHVGRGVVCSDLEHVLFWGSCRKAVQWLLKKRYSTRTLDGLLCLSMI